MYRLYSLLQRCEAFNYFKVTGIICLCLLSFLDTYAAEDERETAVIECRELLVKGLLHYKQGNFLDAIESMTKAESLHDKYNLDGKLLFEIKSNLALSYFNISNYGEAIGYYKEALEVGNKYPDLEEKCVSVTGDIGQLYYYEGDYKSAIEYFSKAYKVDTKKNFKSKSVRAISLALAYNMLEKPKEARKYLIEVKSISKSEEIEKLWQVTYAETFFVEGQFNEAEKQMEGLIGDLKQKWTKNYNSTIFYINAVELLARIYSKKGNIDLAIFYAKKGLTGGGHMVNKKAFYQLLTEFYIQKKDFATALTYKDSVLIAKDSMASMVNRNLFETNKVKLRVQEYQSEIEYNKEKYDSERKLLYSLIIGIVGFVTVIILFFRQKKLVADHNKQAALLELEKEKNEKFILEQAIKDKEAQTQLEYERLRNEIESRNRKLSAKALYLSGRNELIEEVIDSFTNNPGVPQSKEVLDYIKNLKSYIKTDSEWDDFITYFEQVNPHFLKTLQEKHPSLTPADIRFICYVYMNLELKEISTILNITLEACKKRKQRIAKKMDIDADILHSYILQFAG